MQKNAEPLRVGMRKTRCCFETPQIQIWSIILWMQWSDPNGPCLSVYKPYLVGWVARFPISMPRLIGDIIAARGGPTTITGFFSNDWSVDVAPSLCLLEPHLPLLTLFSWKADTAAWEAHKQGRKYLHQWHQNSEECSFGATLTAK